ncbi:hypothetical protein [uncultured Phascolarctobacterium sp.]|uniref:hypothetical protein n=1 Tax=uncultured Phascolarctobacterium sp. TaxID=512296 RepID=UPI002617AA28|nr:hypothetical protein [uncultured Phascolarctobacterium sp.]
MVNDNNKAKVFKSAEWQQSAEAKIRYNVNSSRAKQFLAFMALRGYEELLEEENANADEH